MHSRTPLPATGAVFVDERGGDRSLRVTWHSEAGLVVLSMWHSRVCVGSFRLPAADVPALVETLRTGLDEAYDATRLPDREAG
jgi:hypothetical protein